MDIIEIRRIFKTGDKQQLEMMARGILVRGRSHEYMQGLSRYADEFNEVLSNIDPEDKDYLALVYILAEHLIEISKGACACSIVKKPMYNSPDRLAGILETIGERPDHANYVTRVYSRCLACGKEYESVTVENGFGQNVIWNDLPDGTL